MSFTDPVPTAAMAREVSLMCPRCGFISPEALPYSSADPMRDWFYCGGCERTWSVPKVAPPDRPRMDPRIDYAGRNSQ
jgi:hypothetical protein